MDWLQALVLALMQGLTEFLPISSSGHLILPKEVLGWPDQGSSFDVAVHVGSLFAIVAYFRRDLLDIALGSFQAVQSKQQNQHSLLLLQLAVATVPAGLAGLLFNDYIDEHFRSALVIATTTLIFGLLLGWADIKGQRLKSMAQMTFGLALIIGLFQMLALIPGTSRSGITMTAALILGFRRDSGARFSFLMSVPIIALSGLYKAFELIGQADVAWALIALGVSVSALSAYACVYWFMAAIEKMGMMPFVIYRICLAALLFVLFI